jgi:hypothetical protein
MKGGPALARVNNDLPDQGVTVCSHKLVLIDGILPAKREGMPGNSGCHSGKQAVCQKKD